MDEQTLRGVGGRRRTVRVGAGALVLAACGALVLAGCSGSRGESASGAGSTAEPGGQVAASAVPPSPGTAGSSTADAGTAYGVAGQPAVAGGSAGGVKAPEQLPAVNALSDRSMVRTASLTLRVPDVLATSAKASALAEGLGGFVAGEKTQAS